MGVPITNNSWGGGGFSQALLDAIVAAQQAGSAFVVSAGGSSLNLDVTPSYPASYDVSNVVTVAATDDDDVLASFSSYGSQTVELAAPGVDILTTQLGSTYFTMSGTSAATSFVSGALALILSRFPGLSGEGAAAHMLAHVEKRPSLDGLVATGGRLDAYASLVETPTDVAETVGLAVGEDMGPRLWWSGADREGVRLGLFLSREEPLHLVVFDIRGRRVRTFRVAPRNPGIHEIHWDGCNDEGIRVGGGVYLARLRGNSGSATTRFFLQP
jgi:subtilisin family serine protease